MKYERKADRDVFYDKMEDGSIRKARKTIKFVQSPLSCRETKLNRTVTSALPTSSAAMCHWCCTPRTVNEFVKVSHKDCFSIHWDVTMEISEPTDTTSICIYCLCALFDELKTKYNKSELDTLYMICSFANIYYDEALAREVLEDQASAFYDGVKMTEDVHFVDKYTRKLEEKKDSPTCFWMADCASFGIGRGGGKKKAEDFQNDEDRDNYNIIWATYHYDPFINDDPKDRSRLMANLVTMIDDAMKDDLVRMNAALEIVRAYYRIEKIGETLNQLQLSTEDTVNNSNAIKQLTAAKTQETTMVTNFSKDHGFAAKYAMAKSKGAGTLSAIVRDMKDSNYDFGTVNKYDIETSAAIKQVSDISAESIFKQVGFTSAEYADMVREQAEIIKQLTQELNQKEEELRLFKEKELKQELLEELRDQLLEKGIPTESVDGILEKEYLKNRKNTKL